MLDRYRKPGGFIQLLQLIETTGMQKREAFLKMIQDEDPHWAQAIERKMLTLDRILKWDDNTLAELMGRIHELTLSVAIHGVGKDREERILKSFASGRRRRIMELVQTKTPSANEISSAYVKIIEEVRSLLKQGIFRAEKFDADLIIEENIEEKLGDGTPARANPAVMESTTPMLEPEDVESLKMEAQSNHAEAVEKMSRQLLLLSAENKKLKNEVKTMKDKLEQIRKIA